MVKCLAQGHKHHGRSQDSNSHSDDSAIRTQIRRTKPLGHDTIISRVFPVHIVIVISQFSHDFKFALFLSLNRIVDFI